MRSRKQELLDLVRCRNASPRSQCSTIQRRNGVGVREYVFEFVVRRPQTAGRKRAAKDVAGAGAVDAIDLERRRTNLASATPGEAALVTKRDRDDRGAELASHRFERAAQLLMTGQRGGKLLRRDDRVDVLQQIGDAGPHLLDVDDR